MSLCQATTFEEYRSCRPQADPVNVATASISRQFAGAPGTHQAERHIGTTGVQPVFTKGSIQFQWKHLEQMACRNIFPGVSSVSHRWIDWTMANTLDQQLVWPLGLSPPIHLCVYPPSIDISQSTQAPDLDFMMGIWFGISWMILLFHTVSMEFIKWWYLSGQQIGWKIPKGLPHM